jgi:hypothetical protein
MHSLERMGGRGSGDYTARRRERERRRRQQQERAATRQERSPAREPASAPTDGSARRAAATACRWCDAPIRPRTRGPIPKWWSATCRKRAWEQKRAAESGRAAVEIVERSVVLSVPTPSVRIPRHSEWGDTLRELSEQLDRGALYDRDLPIVAGALRAVPLHSSAALVGGDVHTSADRQLG